MVTHSASQAEVLFQGKDEHEQFQFYFRQHWIRLLVPFLLMMIWSAGIIILGYVSLVNIGVDDAFTRHGILFCLFLFFVFVQWRFLVRLYGHALYVVIVTDRKVHRIKKTLLTFNDHQTVDIWTLQDMQKSQHGVIQYFFNYGTIILEAQDTELRLHFVPRVNMMYDRMTHARELAREHAMTHRRAASPLASGEDGEHQHRE